MGKPMAPEWFAALYSEPDEALFRYQEHESRMASAVAAARSSHGGAA